MKRTLIGIIVAIPLTCIGLFLADWVYTEITFQMWLSQDQRHVDFSLYSDKQLREILLAKLPIGSSEEEVKAFYLANSKYGLVGLNEWEPREDSEGYGVSLQVWAVNHGNIVMRMYGGKRIVSFDLDPVNHTLVDIIVKSFGSEL
ncbi:MAG: hypothetical protein HYR94_27460 [Chloroflexi bacterium]|nr:hypothetical protein [Chloroflexota bacterium]